MRSTKSNESFNAQIWRHTPKHIPLGKPTVDTAVAMAVLEFNKGSSGFISVLETLSIHSGHHFMTYISLLPASGLKMQLAMPPHQ